MAETDTQLTEVSSSPFGGSKLLADHDLAAIRASCIALAIQTCLAIMYIGAFVVFLMSGGVLPSSRLIEMIGGGCMIAEFGIFIFLTHCFFLFPRLITASVIAPLGSLLIVVVQIVIAIIFIASSPPPSRPLAPNSLGITLGMVFAFVIGLLISGWFLYRLLGTSLTMGGEDVYQSAINTKILLSIAPLFLVMGLVPTVFMRTFAEGQVVTHFASTVVIFAFQILLSTVVPLLAMFACFVLLRLKGRWAWFTATSISVGLVVPCVLLLEIVDLQSRLGVSIVFISGIIVYFAGLAAAVAPFYWFGFRPVWAKRKQVVEAEPSASFDHVN